MLWGGNPILGLAKANFTIAPNKLDLAIAQASLANGVLKGDISATLGSALPPAKPALPAIAAKFSVTGADGSMFSLPFDFPITLAGSIDAAGDLTASGYAPQAWLATLSGNASLAAQSGSLNGFSLPGAVNALTAKNPPSEPAARGLPDRNHALYPNRHDRPVHQRRPTR